MAEGLFQLYKNAPITLRPPAHCSSPEIAFAERCPQINMTEKEAMPEAMNPFLAFNKGKYFSKFKLSLVIWTTFEFPAKK